MELTPSNGFPPHQDWPDLTTSRLVEVGRKVVAAEEIFAQLDRT